MGREKQAEASLVWANARERMDSLLGNERASTLRALVDECIQYLQANAPLRIALAHLGKPAGLSLFKTSPLDQNEH